LRAKGIAPQETGAVAVDLVSGKVVYAHNSAVGFVPASNEKLPVTYAALKVLGPSLPLPDEVRGQGSLGSGGTWNGNIVLKATATRRSRRGASAHSCARSGPSASDT
jgi:D-alanyl-D-alanine carboxypeptidase